MKTLNASEFKAKCLAMMDEVAQTGEPVTILKHGKAVAQLVPAPPSEAKYPQQELMGTVKILGDILEPVLPPDVWEANTGTVLDS